MPKRQRDYTNLKESERVWDAVEMNSTNVKDYSLKHLCSTLWRLSDREMRRRLVRIRIGDEEWMGVSPILTNHINDMADEADDDNYFPRWTIELKGEKGTLHIDTSQVSQECLQDHVARVTIGKNTAMIDLEELLKATRYA